MEKIVAYGTEPTGVKYDVKFLGERTAKNELFTQHNQFPFSLSSSRISDDDRICWKPICGLRGLEVSTTTSTILLPFSRWSSHCRHLRDNFCHALVNAVRWFRLLAARQSLM